MLRAGPKGMAGLPSQQTPIRLQLLLVLLLPLVVTPLWGAHVVLEQQALPPEQHVDAMAHGAIGAAASSAATSGQPGNGPQQAASKFVRVERGHPEEAAMQQQASAGSEGVGMEQALAAGSPSEDGIGHGQHPSPATDMAVGSPQEYASEGGLPAGHPEPQAEQDQQQQQQLQEAWRIQQERQRQRKEQQQREQQQQQEQQQLAAQQQQAASQMLQAAVAAQSAEGAAAAAAAVAAVADPHAAALHQALGPLTPEQLRRDLKSARRLLFDPERRNVVAAARALRQLGEVAQRASRSPAAGFGGPLRRKLYQPQPPPMPDAVAGTAAQGAELAAAAAVADVAALQAQAAAPAAVLLAQALRLYNGTGVDAAANAMFSLAALQSHHLLAADGFSASNTEATLALHHAALAGSVEAMYALADRFAHGHGVVRDETVALSYARLAGQWLIDSVEAEQKFTAPLAPVDMREAWMDRRYISAEEVENADRVLAMDEDMALRGNLDAQQRMAYRRLLGRGIEADPEGAYRDFEAAAQQGDAYATFNLGFMHTRGLFVPVNHTKAREYFKQAADKNLPAAWSGLGTMYWTGNGGEKNLTAALDAYLKGAALNNSDCYYNLGIMFLHGVGTDKNETKACEYFAQSDALGHWKGSFTLATIYESGTGVPKNVTKALRYYRKLFVDRANWTEAIRRAADAYDDRDYWGALAHLVLAAEQGSDTAAVNAAWMIRRGKGYTGPKALDLAAGLYERAARQGSAVGAVEYANLLYNAQELGLSRPRNLTEVLYWYERAAEANSTEGMYCLAWAHHRGVGVERNLTHAAELYHRAVRAAGRSTTQFPRMVAPWLGLLSMRLDRMLQPLFGPDATYLLALALQDKLRLRPGQRSGHGRGGREEHQSPARTGGGGSSRDAGDTGAEAVGRAGGQGQHDDDEEEEEEEWGERERVRASDAAELGRLLLGALVHALYADGMLVSVMIASLVAVLFLRHRSGLERRRQQQQQQQRAEQQEGQQQGGQLQQEQVS